MVVNVDALDVERGANERSADLRNQLLEGIGLAPELLLKIAVEARRVAAPEAGNPAASAQAAPGRPEAARAAAQAEVAQEAGRVVPASAGAGRMAAAAAAVSPALQTTKA